MRILISLVAACLIALPAAAEPVRAVASFSILGDMVERIGGDRVEVTTLVGPNGDGHVYQPTPADARTLAGAELLVVNGLGFEGWMDRLIASAGYAGPVVVAARDVVPRRMEGSATTVDPHAWQSLGNARAYARTIAAGLTDTDPAGAAVYAANLAAWLDAIAAVGAEVHAMVAALPTERRRVITSHDAFGYFGEAYGLDFIAPQGVSTEAEASAGDVAALIRQIRAERVPALFIENISDSRLLEQIARETDAVIGGTLYSDALSDPDGPAGSYLDMIRHNVRVIGAALGV